MTDFKKGDLVALKSGGPNMTIKGIGIYDWNKHDSALCVYFNEKNKMIEQTFELETLIKLEDSS